MAQQFTEQYLMSITFHFITFSYKSVFMIQFYPYNKVNILKPKIPQMQNTKKSMMPVIFY